MDQPTYTALQSVPTFAVGGIDVSASCKAPNTIQPLKTKYSVCVMPGTQDQLESPSDLIGGVASTPTMAPVSSVPGATTPVATSSTTQTALIVGATLGAVAVVGLCVAAFVCYRRKRRAAKPYEELTLRQGSNGRLFVGRRKQPSTEATGARKRWLGTRRRRDTWPAPPSTWRSPHFALHEKLQVGCVRTSSCFDSTNALSLKSSRSPKARTAKSTTASTKVCITYLSTLDLTRH